MPKIVSDLPRVVNRLCLVLCKYVTSCVDWLVRFLFHL